MRSITVENCPACGCEATSTVFSPTLESWRRFEALSNRKYKGCMNTWADCLDLQVKKCTDCQHLWQHTHPEFSSLMEMYACSVPLNENIVSHEPSSDVVSIMENLFDLVKSRLKVSPTFLDYGSGRGKWAKAAARVGFEVWAYEPSATRSNDGFKGEFTLVNKLEELECLSFDIINLEQVLEHTQEPYEILKGLVPFLKYDSVVRITTPNLRLSKHKNLWKDFPFSGASMHLLSPYEHLQGFNGRSLKMLLNRANLSQVNSVKAWKTHPALMTRYFFGKVFPGIATTFALVSLSSDSKYLS